MEVHEFGKERECVCDGLIIHALKIGEISELASAQGSLRGLSGESEGAKPSLVMMIFWPYRYFPKETIGPKKVLQMQDFSIVWLS